MKKYRIKNRWIEVIYQFNWHRLSGGDVSNLSASEAEAEAEKRYLWLYHGFS